MALATDPSWCSKGAQYFCCDNPVKIPDKPDVKLDFCYSTDGDFVEATEKDDAAEDNDDYLELWWYEDKCFSIPNKGDPSSQTRRAIEDSPYTNVKGLHRSEVAKLFTEDGRLLEVPVAESWVQDLLELSIAQAAADGAQDQHNGTLEERNGSRFSKICKPDKTVINTFNTSPYPGVGALSPSRLVFNLGTTGICFSAALVQTSHQQLANGLKTVVEHGKCIRTFICRDEKNIRADVCCRH